MSNVTRFYSCSPPSDVHVSRLEPSNVATCAPYAFRPYHPCWGGAFENTAFSIEALTLLDGRHWVTSLLRDAVVAATRHIAERHKKTCNVTVNTMADADGVSTDELWVNIYVSVWSFVDSVPDYVTDAETNVHLLPEVDRLCRVYFDGHEPRTHVIRFMVDLNGPG